MNTFLLIVTTITISAIIGGVTNYLAIKMLFRPRRALYLAGRKLPFTPGIIPKRKEEIAESLGRVVGDYLVTSEGLAGLLRQEAFQARLTSRLKAVLEDLAQDERSLRDWASYRLGEEKVTELLAQAEKGLSDGTNWLVRWLIEEKGLLQRPIADWLPGEGVIRKEEWSYRLADVLVQELSRQLLSPSGVHLIRTLANKLMDQAGGVFGMLAGIFVDVDRMVQKVQPIVLESLHSQEVRKALADLIQRQWERLESKTLEEIIRYFAEGEPDQIVRSWVRQWVPWQRWVEEAAARSVASWIAPLLPKALEYLPGWVEMGLDTVASRMHKVIQVLDLPTLVGKQVRNFPVEQLENIVLAVSGREFRAITWLGALLGGMIGLLQFVLVTVLR